MKLLFWDVLLLATLAGGAVYTGHRSVVFIAIWILWHLSLARGLFHLLRLRKDKTYAVARITLAGCLFLAPVFCFKLNGDLRGKNFMRHQLPVYLQAAKWVKKEVNQTNQWQKLVLPVEFDLHTKEAYAKQYPEGPFVIRFVYPATRNGILYSTDDDITNRLSTLDIPRPLFLLTNGWYRF